MQIPHLDHIRAVSFRHVTDTTPDPFAGSWVQLWSRLAFHRTHAFKKQGQLWSPVVYQPGSRRGNSGVLAVTCLVVDMDGEAFDHARLDGLEWTAYTTWSHREDDQHWHLVIPLDKPVPAHRWHEVWTRLHERINVVGDPSTKDPARMFFMPQHQAGNPFGFKSGSGVPLPTELSEMFTMPSRDWSVRVGKNLRQPNKFGSDHYVFSEDWWTEPQDLSRFVGLTEEQVASRLLCEFRELRERLAFS